MHQISANVWGWGNLGVDTIVSIPTRLASPPDIHSFFLSKSAKLGWSDTQVYSWTNSLLDPPTTLATSSPLRHLVKFQQTLFVSTDSSEVESIDEDNVSSQVTFPAEITGLVCGNEHALALTSAGQVYSWGEASHGKLGLGEQMGFVSSPQYVSALEGISIVQVACGYSHSLALDSAGRVYSWGVGDDGRLGHGECKHYTTPTQVTALDTKCVKKVTCGYLHSLVLTNTGEVLGFGFNGYGQLGLGHTGNELTPVLCYRLVCANIIEVGCGGFHSVCLGDEGSVYTMGLGTKGQLGAGDLKNREVPVCLPSKFKPVQFITCGPDTTLLIGDLLDLDELNQINSSTAPTELFEYFTESFETNFRPANLPAKDPQEAAAHKELVAQQERKYLERVKEQEKEARRAREEQVRKEEKVREHMRVWEYDVLPNWGKMKKGKLVRELVCTGIPPKFRGSVWSKLAGNPQSINYEYFSIHYQKAVSQRDTPTNEGQRNLIFLDARRTFSQNGYFRDGSPLQQQLIDLLEVFVVVRPDIGYIQGMSYLAAMLIINFDDTYKAFVLFLSTVTSPMVLPFYKVNEELIQERYQLFRVVFNENLPELCEHFETQGVHPQMYLFEWFTTIFSRSLNQDVGARVWDLYFYFGPEILFKAGLAILKLLYYILLPENIHGIMKNLRAAIDLITDGDVLVEQIQSIQIPEWIRTELCTLAYETL